MATGIVGETTRGRIADALNEKAETVWRVMNHNETQCAKEFNRQNSRNPEGDCRAWVAERNKLHPEYVAGRGYQAIPYSVWPNYLGLTAAGARFINWGLKHLDEPGRVNLDTRMHGGETAPMALAAILFPEPA